MKSNRGLLVMVDPTGRLAERLRELLLSLAADLPVETVDHGDCPELGDGPVDFVAVGTTGDAAPQPNGRARDPLTRRELEILQEVSRGRSNSAIARDLFISQDTVRFHLRNAYRKLGVHDRVEAGRLAGVDSNGGR